MSASAEARNKMRAAAIRAVTIAGQDLEGRAQREAPLEEGTLRGSSRTEVVETQSGVSSEVSFNTVYARRQHEETTWEHPRAGKAKYLEDPLKEMAPRYEAAIGKAVGQAIR